MQQCVGYCLRCVNGGCALPRMKSDEIFQKDFMGLCAGKLLALAREQSYCVTLYSTYRAGLVWKAVAHRVQECRLSDPVLPCYAISGRRLLEHSNSKLNSESFNLVYPLFFCPFSIQPSTRCSVSKATSPLHLLDHFFTLSSYCLNHQL